MDDDIENLQIKLEVMTISEIRSNYKVPSKFTTKKSIISYIVDGPPAPKEDTYPRIKEITPEIFSKVNGKIFKLSEYSMFSGFVQVVGHTKAMLKVRKLKLESKHDRYGSDYWIDKEWFEANPYKKTDPTKNYYLYEQKKLDEWNKDFPYSIKLEKTYGYKHDINLHYYRTSHD